MITISDINPNDDLVFFCSEDISSINTYFSKEELNYIQSKLKKDEHYFTFSRLHQQFFFINDKHQKSEDLEKIRKAGDSIQMALNAEKKESFSIVGVSDKDRLIALVEGIRLGNYQFVKYKQDKKKNTLSEVKIQEGVMTDTEVEELNIVLDAVCFCRDLVNEPIIKLDAVKFAEQVEAKAQEAGMKTEVFNKTKIESLKMGGLLAVNKGSIDPPTFTILEYKPENAINEKPLIFVGKGVVYDTGGLNIKTANYMDNMKSDMAGAAGMAAVSIAIAKAKLPIYIVCLLPATDNRLNGNAYASGDVITMYNGTTVEVLNTDAEGRMILADALSYASQYDPELVIDMATLTGAAVRAIGSNAITGMQVKARTWTDLLIDSGYKVFERIAELPMWDDYKEQLKSDIADQKNIGGVEAGAITAAKFLESFTNYPYIHLDIAGPAYKTSRDSYRNVMGTGVGVRLLFDFTKQFIDQQKK